MIAGDVIKIPPHVEEVIAALAVDPTVNEIWLIGSQARGSASLTSDWDLLVQSEREPQRGPRRHRGIDVLWCGPSGACQVESERNYPILNFNDFEWESVDSATATYTARRYINYDPRVGRDTSEPVYDSNRQQALLLWRRESA
jgi:Nucleotidyltransferase domain